MIVDPIEAALRKYHGDDWFRRKQREDPDAIAAARIDMQRAMDAAARRQEILVREIFGD